MKHKIWMSLAGLVLFAASGGAKDLVLKTANTVITLDEKGYYASIQVEGKEILKEGASPLVTACDEGKLLHPTELVASGNKIKLLMPDRQQVQLKYEESQHCVTLEVVKVPDGYDALLFGPLSVTIHDVVGDVVGVAQGQGVAFGVQALNIKTTAGVPEEYIEVVSAHDPAEGASAELSVGSVPAYRLAATEIEWKDGRGQGGTVRLPGERGALADWCDRGGTGFAASPLRGRVGKDLAKGHELLFDQ